MSISTCTHIHPILTLVNCAKYLTREFFFLVQEGKMEGNRRTPSAVESCTGVPIV